MDFLAHVADISQIISAICIILGLGYGAYQYKDNKKLLRIMKAAELSKEYADQLIEPMNIITKIFYSQIEIKSIIKKIEIHSLETFDYDELNRLLTREEIGMIISYSQIHLADSKEDMKLSDAINDIMNRLEYFSIFFNSNVADGKTVYQSLHQSYFKFIPIIYVFVGICNKNKADKCYTNIIELYVEWKTIHKRQLEKEKKANEKIEKYKNKNKISIRTNKA